MIIAQGLCTAVDITAYQAGRQAGRQAGGNHATADRSPAAVDSRCGCASATVEEESSLRKKAGGMDCLRPCLRSRRLQVYERLERKTGGGQASKGKGRGRTVVGNGGVLIAGGILSYVTWMRRKLSRG